MDWSNERFIKVYTRDTADWMTLSFDAQALFMMILRKVDRAGRLELGRHGAKAVAVAIGHGPLWSRLEPALRELLADGCIQITSDNKTLLIRNFVEAQEARKSNAQRQRDFKEDKRTKATLPPDPDESNSALPDDNETLADDNETSPKGNEQKHAVTRGNPSEQNRLEQNRQPNPQTPLPSAGAPPASPAASAKPKRGTERKTKDIATTPLVHELFEHWKAVMESPRSKLDKKRDKFLRWATEQYTLEDCKRAVWGCFHSDFHMNREGGGNDRDTRFNDVSVIFRDAKQVDKFLAVLDQHEAKSAKILAEKQQQIAAYEASQVMHPPSEFLSLFDEPEKEAAE